MFRTVCYLVDTEDTDTNGISRNKGSSVQLGVKEKPKGRS